MGRTHFQQMYDEAAEIDAAAYARLLLMITPTASEDQFDNGASPWDNMYLDNVMEAARAINDIGIDFADELARLVDTNQADLSVRLPNGMNVWTDDTKAIDFDEPTVSVKEFLDSMMRLPNTLCNEEQKDA